MPDIKYLELLSDRFPNIMAATAEYINIKAVMALPKGTEYFLSDLHGEHEAFIHMIRSASGTIKNKIDEHYGEILSEEDREDLASLIYNPEAEIARRKKSESDFNRWCVRVIYRLITICKSVSTKYTRARVRDRLPEYFNNAMDELLHADDEANRSHYYSQIINTIVYSTEYGEKFICEMADAISCLAVDQLHIIGDIFDRGARPDAIMEYLMNFHDVDFEWGNHDIVWMGAAAGNWACIANIIRMNVSYNNFDMLQVGYGINLRPLTVFADKVYGDDKCEKFWPHILDKNKFDPIDDQLAARMHKAIAVIQFKIEGRLIENHPEFNLDHRRFLETIDFDASTVVIEGKTWKMTDCNLPTVDPDDPYRLTDEETAVMHALEASILNSEKLQRHIRFMFDRGGLYKTINGNLLYHGCIPMDEDGEFTDVSLYGGSYSGKALMDHLEKQIRSSYFTPEKVEEYGGPGDLMWYLWLGRHSPLFGKEKMTTFERLFIEDKASHNEPIRPYYNHVKHREPCRKIIREFGLDPERAKILNGHVPVKIKKGESPIKGEGMLYVIDGGISKAYQKKTGIAGYTFIFNSRFMALAEHKPYSPLKEDGSQEFHSPVIKIVDTLPERMMIADTDFGLELQQRADALNELIDAYKKGLIKERTAEELEKI
jgi:fructose-1,6-bisphosphatase-3